MGAAAVCAVCFAALGYFVTRAPLTRIDVESVALRGTNIPLAIVFTNSGYGFALTCLGVGSVVAALVLRAPVIVPLAILASQILSQAAANLLKSVFERARPDVWLYRHELGYSYPSGHATTAIVFYGAWLVVAWMSPLPPLLRVAVAATLVVWIAGIGWSRVVLGAHYPTDVLGGYLFGCGWLCAGMALALTRGAGLAARGA